ncbi:MULTISPECIES: hypothetical protein [unclassified Gilliamella]|nr:hypothetical protein [Gilliamella apicola]
MHVLTHQVVIQYPVSYLPYQNKSVHASLYSSAQPVIVHGYTVGG